MKTCFDCGAEFQPNARFCSQCGRNFRAPKVAKAAKAAKSVRRQEPPEAASPRSSYPHDESIEAWEELKASKRNRAKGFFTVGAVLAVAAAVIFGLPALIGGVALTIIVLSFTLRMSASDYYSIPHARDAEDEHRCIFCGNRGIWYKGIYRSNAKVANCSKCKEELFQA
jgi:predicted RNA-binding Zn-ribbon protein involved in translation (DUF1610 family)